MRQSLRDPSPSDEVFGALATDRRRRIVACLAEQSGAVTLGRPAAEVANGSLARDVVNVSTLEVELHHVDLPALAQAGLVAYDHEAGLVTYEGPAEVEELVTAVEELVA